DFAIATVHVGREHRGDAPAGHGLAEDQVALGQIDADVFSLQREIADAVALVTVEAVFAHRARDVGGGSGEQAGRRREPQCEYPHDSSILQPERPARLISQPFSLLHVRHRIRQLTFSPDRRIFKRNLLVDYQQDIMPARRGWIAAFWGTSENNRKAKSVHR